jgi:MscS family membrane protein
VVWIAENLDMDIAALVAGLGIGGVALALASKDTVENFFGALSILADRPFQVGDWIVMNDIEGTVVEVGFRTTRVRTFYNSLITFPNSMLIRTAVDNLGAREYRRIKETIGVAYDTPPEKLEAFLEGIREIVRRHPYTRKDYFHVYFHRFGDSALDILLYIFVKTPDWATELRERQRLLLDILRLANELGVEFAFPTRTLHLVQGEAADHGERSDDIAAARRSGRRAARTIVDRFTGRDVPPPVEITGRPDEALDEGE